jgi:uncharacterized protein
VAKARSSRILISGASGFIGTELVRQLESDGHTVLKLVRSKPHHSNEFHWAPSAGMIDHGLFETVDAVVNLSGASTGRLPWTAKYKQQIRSSRVDTTRTLANAISMARNPPPVFLNGSAVGIYGDRPGEELTESSDRGTGFFPDVVDAWESATGLAPAATRVVHMRTGVVVGHGGAFTPLLPLTRFGLGARFGNGAQYWPWVSLHDEVAAIRHLLTSRLSGPVNLVGPTPATSNDITSQLAEGMHRWYRLAVPAGLIRGVLGEAGDALLLASERVVPAKLLADGLEFQHETAGQAIAAMLA